MTGPHSKIPKFTRSRPFGLPQTPFNPKSGKYLPFTKDPNILNVVVERKLTTADNMYLCSVLDSRTIKSGDHIHAQRLIYGSVVLDDIPENTVLHSFKVDNKWWIQTGDESDLPTVDFIVDMFDRANYGNLGTYWDDSAYFRIYDQQAVHNKTSGEIPYQAKLSSHNLNFKMWYSSDDSGLLAGYNNLKANPDNSHSQYYSYPFAFLIGWDIPTSTGVEIASFMLIERDIDYGPIYVKYYIYQYSVADPTQTIYEHVEVLTSFGQVKTTGTILFTINENICTWSGDPWAGNWDMLAVYNTSAGLRQPIFYSSYPSVLVDNFKSWVSSIPEPPDESGHGRYIDGQFVYSDKYHAGGEYNPDA